MGSAIDIDGPDAAGAAARKAVGSGSGGGGGGEFNFEAELDDLVANPVGRNQVWKKRSKAGGPVCASAHSPAARSAANPATISPAAGGVAGKGARYIFYPQGPASKFGSCPDRVIFNAADAGQSASSLLEYVCSLERQHATNPLSGDVRLDQWDKEYGWKRCTGLPASGAELAIVPADAAAAAATEARSAGRRCAFAMMRRGARAQQDQQDQLTLPLTPPDTELIHGARYGWKVWRGDTGSGGEHLAHFRSDPVAAAREVCTYAQLPETAIRLVPCGKDTLEAGEQVNFDFSPTALQYFVQQKMAVNVHHAPAARKLVTPQEFLGVLAKARKIAKGAKKRRFVNAAELEGQLQEARTQAASAQPSTMEWMSASASVLRLERELAAARVHEVVVAGKKAKIAKDAQIAAANHNRFDANSKTIGAVAAAAARARGHLAGTADSTPCESSGAASSGAASSVVASSNRQGGAGHQPAAARALLGLAALKNTLTQRLSDLQKGSDSRPA
jgi:hypothetical protein